MVRFDLFAGVWVRPINTSLIYSYPNNVAVVDYIRQTYFAGGILWDMNYTELTGDDYCYAIYDNVDTPDSFTGLYIWPRT